MAPDVGVYSALFAALYFEVFLLITFFEKRPNNRSAKRPLYFPSVAIIVPCYNEEKTLEATVRSLLALDYPTEKLEILIVNDGSKDGTAAVARQFKEHPQVRILEKENGGKYTALNMGLAHTNAELIGCLDADSFVAPDALIEMVKKFNENPNAMAASPSILVHQPSSLLQHMQRAEYSFGVFYKKMFETLSAIPVLPGPFSLYRREVFETIGPFKHAYNTEDMEIALRMQSRRMVIANTHTARVYTTTPRTIRSLIRQRTRWSQGFLQNGKDYWYMFGNPRFGHLGLFVLPFGLLSILFALFLAGYALWEAAGFAGRTVADAIVLKEAAVPVLSFGEFSPLYLSSVSLWILTAVVICTTLLLIGMGRWLSRGTLRFRDIASYLVLYGFIAPIWLAKASWGAARGTVSVWK